MVNMQGISIRLHPRSVFKIYIKKISYYIYTFCNSVSVFSIWPRCF